MADNRAWENSIDNATAEIIRRMIQKVDKSCLVIEAAAKASCPVDMGQLRASITSETEFTQKAITGRIGSNLFDAPFVHQGTGIYAADGDGRKTPWVYQVHAGKYKGWHYTKGQKPQPFLKNAVLQNKSKIGRILSG